MLFSKVKFLGRKDRHTLFTTVMSESEQGFYFICEIYSSNWSRNFRSRLLGSHIHWWQVGSWDRCQRHDYHIWGRWWLWREKVGQQQEQLWNWTVRDYLLIVIYDLNNTICVFFRHFSKKMHAKRDANFNSWSIEIFSPRTELSFLFRIVLNCG